MLNLFHIIFQCALMLGPPWFALRAAKLAKAKGAQADILIRWATGTLILAGISILFGYYSLWDIHTDPDWIQRNVDAPGIVLMFEAIVYPLLAVVITLPFATFIWWRSKKKMGKRDLT